jgi:hypothetical protein
VKVVFGTAFAAVLLANAPVATASPDVDPHQQWAVDKLGPPLCADLDQNPDAQTVDNFIQSLSGVTLSDGWTFQEDDAKPVALASIIAYCPQYQGLYFATPEAGRDLGAAFGKGFLQGLLGG